MNEETLASELLHELKATSRRWFIAFLIVLALWFATIGAFVWYISLPVEETTTVDLQNDDGNLNYLEDSSVNGDINNGKNEKDNVQKTQNDR